MAGSYHFTIPDLGHVERPYTCGCGLPLTHPAPCGVCRAAEADRATRRAYRQAGEYVPGSYNGRVRLGTCRRCQRANVPVRQDADLGRYVHVCKPCRKELDAP